MEDFLFIRAEEKNSKDIYRVVSEVFDEFVAPSYIEEGIKEFYKYLDEPAIRTRLQSNLFILLCKHKNEVIGLIEVRNFDHISMLFVKHNYQGKGIAKELLKRALELCQKNNPELKELSVNASPNSVVIYERLGFYKTKDEQIKNGIRFTPMSLRL